MDAERLLKRFGAQRQKQVGAEEGTRTPTPLRVHGPEPCASANSATSALNEAPDKNRRLRREILIHFKGFAECVKRSVHTGMIANVRSLLPGVSVENFGIPFLKPMNPSR